MAKLETQYIGLKLKNPVVVSSSGLTNSVEKLKKIDAQGAGAVVLKSLFEEQINYETGDLLKHNDYPEAEDYIRTYARDNSVKDYISLIEGGKKETNLPIIASINCVTANDWTDFALQVQDAGADALELNMHIVPTEKNREAKSYEERYFEIVRTVQSKISIPVVAKIGAHFTNLLYMADGLAGAGAKGIVLFNRFYEPDIDIEKFRIVSAEIFSTPADIRQSLRWVGILSQNINLIDIAASTGIHDGKGVIKQLLAGATAAQVCSTLYQNGFDKIPQIIAEIEDWMNRKGFDTIDEFRGKLNYNTIEQPSMYERAQFMKYFSSVE